MFSDSMGSENALSLTQAFLGGFNAARQISRMAAPIFPALFCLQGARLSKQSRGPGKVLELRNCAAT
jgi:hypothetical protein